MAGDILNKQTILSVQDVKSTVIEVPEWGGCVRIREMTVNDRLAYWDLVKDAKNGEKIPVHQLLAMALVDENGNLIFNPAEAEALQTKNGAVVDRILGKWLEFNGLAPASIEQEVKN